MTNAVLEFIIDESGAGALEYALVLIILTSMVALVSTNLKVQVSNLMSGLGSNLNNGLNNIS